MQSHVFFSLAFVVCSCIVLAQSRPIDRADDYQVKRKVIYTPDAPAPVAPFSQAVQINYMLYLFGQIGIDPKTGQLVSNSTANQTKQILKNLETILDAAGSSVQQIAHCLIILTHLDEDYATVNEIYSSWFPSSAYYPARSSIGALKLPFNATVAIECQAYTTREI